MLQFQQPEIMDTVWDGLETLLVCGLDPLIL